MEYTREGEKEKQRMKVKSGYIAYIDPPGLSVSIITQYKSRTFLGTWLPAVLVDEATQSEHSSDN